jgi:hypothetical protein
VTPYRNRRGQNQEAKGGGADRAALSNGRVGSSPENRDRSHDLESPWGGIAKALLDLRVPSDTSNSDIRR